MAIKNHSQRNAVLPPDIATARRTLGWAAERLSADGSFAEAEDRVSAYYLAPLAFALGGRPDLAQSIAEYARANFFCCGDINARGGEADSQVATFRNAFFGLSCQRLGALDLALAQSERLARQQHPSLGGFANNECPGRVLDLGSSAAALIALLATGHLAAARAAGDFLRSEMILGQPEPESHILLRRRWEGPWISEFAAADAGRHQIELGKPGQIYWHLGIVMAALGQLYLAGGEVKYLAAAERVFGWAEACRPGSFKDLTAAKVGWGAAVLYAATGSAVFADCARAVGTMLRDTQLAEGVWLRRPAVTQLAGQDTVTLLDTSLERVCWLLEIARYVSVPENRPNI